MNSENGYLRVRPSYLGFSFWGLWSNLPPTHIADLCPLVLPLVPGISPGSDTVLPHAVHPFPPTQRHASMRTLLEGRCTSQGRTMADDSENTTRSYRATDALLFTKSFPCPRIIRCVDSLGSLPRYLTRCQFPRTLQQPPSNAKVSDIAPLSTLPPA